MRDYDFSRRSVLRTGAALAATGSGIAYKMTQQPVIATSGDWAVSDLETTGTDSVQEVHVGEGGEVVLHFSNLEENTVYDVPWTLEARLTEEGEGGVESTAYQQIDEHHGSEKLDTEEQGTDGSKSYWFYVTSLDDDDEFRGSDNGIVEEHSDIHLEDFHSDDPPEDVTVELRLTVRIEYDDTTFAESIEEDTFTVTISSNETTSSFEGDGGTSLDEE